MNNNSVSINFVGDIALFKQFQSSIIDPFKDVELPTSNYNVGNFEFPVSNAKIKKFYDASDEYLIDDHYAKTLKLNTFDLYSLANNHISDYGSEGIESTVALINAAGASWFGLSEDDDYSVFTKSINGIKFAFVAAVKDGRWKADSSMSKGPNIIDFEILNNTVQTLKAKVDHVIVYFHWGTELVDAPITSDVDAARTLIDQGASCVIGHHPHVTQGVENYKAGIIAYSLGSFIYLSEFEKGNFDKAEIRDISMCLNIQFSKDAVITHTPYKYQRMSHNLIPNLAGEFTGCTYYQHLNEVIGSHKYYSSKVRSVLLKRELYSFFVRFKQSPTKALAQYFSYIRLEHFKKILGISK